MEERQTITSKRTELDYMICIPSRKRAERMKKTLALYPDATIWVHESERDDYLRVVPENQLRCHKENGLANIRAEMILRTEESCVVMSDDDVRGVQVCEAPKPFLIEGAGEIRAIIENQIQICRDLNVNMFGWNMSANPLHYWSVRPFSFTTIPLVVWGVIGKEIYPDRRLQWYGEEMDCVLQNLLEHRIIIQDNRFCFICYGNGVGDNDGGAQGLRTKRSCDADYALLRKKWGHYAVCGQQAKINTNVNTYRVNVSRKASVLQGKD